MKDKIEGELRDIYNYIEWLESEVEFRKSCERMIALQFSSEKANELLNLLQRSAMTEEIYKTLVKRANLKSVKKGKDTNER